MSDGIAALIDDGCNCRSAEGGCNCVNGGCNCVNGGGVSSNFSTIIAIIFVIVATILIIWRISLVISKSIDKFITINDATMRNLLMTDLQQDHNWKYDLQG
jgi:hypothetical protein